MTIAKLYLQLKEIGLDDNDIYLHGLHGSTDDNKKLSLTILKGKIRLYGKCILKNLENNIL